MDIKILKDLIKESGKTQKDIAFELKISQQRLSNYVSGIREPDNETLLVFANYFGVSLDYLLGREPVIESTRYIHALPLRELRKSKNLSVKQLSELIGIQERSIYLYENGKQEPNYETLLKLADFFDVSIDYLLGRTDESEQTKKPAIGELLELSKNKQEILSLLDQVSEDNREMVDRAVKALIQSIIDNQ